jgi:hypothetical protein
MSLSQTLPQSLSQTLSLALILTSTSLGFAASLPSKTTILPDNVVRCEPSAGCINQKLFGRDYKVLATPRFTVMVSVSREGAYTRADVSVSNNTDTPLSLTPEDFRVEVLTPKPKVLLYIAPADLLLPPPPAAQAATPQAATPQAPALPSGLPSATLLQTASTTPPSDPAAATAALATATLATATQPAPPSDVEAIYIAAEQKAARQEVVDKAAAEKNLSATLIAPNEVTRGRVYFARDKKSHLVNVVLPIAGLVFEFPYAMKR